MNEIHHGSTDVYADIGLPDADEMLEKAQLVTAIRQVIKANGWTLQKAAEVMRQTQSNVSKMLRGQFRGISKAELLGCLANLERAALPLT